MVKWNWRKSRIIFPRQNEHLVCNCILFTKLPRPGDDEGEHFGLRVKLPIAHLPTTHCGDLTLSLIAEHQAGKL